jgi:hypothetical protein
MDATNLRSRLVFLLGDELKNLTVTDLKECSFRTSRLVFSSIVFAGRTLQEEAEKLSIVNDSRTRKLGLLRNQSHSREERKRVEEEYRHTFYGVILNALLDLQYPPALEPFSDPLSSLKEDVEFRLAAMQYLLDNAVVGAGSVTDVSSLSLQSESDENNSQHVHSVQSSSRDFTIADLSTDCDHPPASSKTKSRKQQQQQQQQQQPHDMQAPPSPPPASSTNTNIHDSDQRQRPRSEGGKHPNPSLSEYATLQHSFEILQHHNEQLSKQLKVLQDSVCQRNAMEVKMDLLMRDFSSMVSEIADISSSPVESFAPPATPPSQPKTRPLGAVLGGMTETALVT